MPLFFLIRDVSVNWISYSSDLENELIFNLDVDLTMSIDDLMRKVDQEWHVRKPCLNVSPIVMYFRIV